MRIIIEPHPSAGLQDLPGFVDDSFTDLASPRFELDVSGLLGEGAFSQVFEVQFVGRTTDEKTYVAKVNKPSTGTSKLQDNVTLLHEFRMISSVEQHENIVRNVGFFQASIESNAPTNKLVLLLQEKYSANLATFLHVHRTLGHSQATIVMQGLLSALEHIHRRHLLHRDVKPDNLLLSPEGGRVILSDFGMALQVCEPPTSTSLTTWTCGTPGFIGPEVWIHRKGNAKTDTFAAGVVMYMCLFGFNPFVDDPSTDSTFAIRRNTLERSPCIKQLRFSNSENCKELARLLSKDLAKRPSASVALRDAWLSVVDVEDLWTQSLNEVTSILEKKREESKQKLEQEEVQLPFWKEDVNAHQHEEGKELKADKDQNHDTRETTPTSSGFLSSRFRFARFTSSRVSSVDSSADVSVESNNAGPLMNKSLSDGRPLARKRTSRANQRSFLLGGLSLQPRANTTPNDEVQQPSSNALQEADPLQENEGEDHEDAGETSRSSGFSWALGSGVLRRIRQVAPRLYTGSSAAGEVSSDFAGVVSEPIDRPVMDRPVMGKSLSDAHHGDRGRSSHAAQRRYFQLTGRRLQPRSSTMQHASNIDQDLQSPTPQSESQRGQRWLPAMPRVFTSS